MGVGGRGRLRKPRHALPLCDLPLVPATEGFRRGCARGFRSDGRSVGGERIGRLIAFVAALLIKVAALGLPVLAQFVAPEIECCLPRERQTGDQNALRHSLSKDLTLDRSHYDRRLSLATLSSSSKRP